MDFQFDGEEFVFV